MDTTSAEDLELVTFCSRGHANMKAVVGQPQHITYRTLLVRVLQKYKCTLWVPVLALCSCDS